MKVTHTSTIDSAALPPGVDLCELEECDVVYLNYNPKTEGTLCVSLVSGGKTVAETDDILRIYGKAILYLGKYDTGFLPEKQDLYCRDLRYVAAAVKYVYEHRILRDYSFIKTDPERLVPFPDEKSAIDYLKSIDEWEYMTTSKYAPYRMENWQPI